MNTQIETIEEAIKNGRPILNRHNHNDSDKQNILLWGNLINPIFKEYVVATSVVEIEDTIERLRQRPKEENKKIWVHILRNLNQYDEPTLNMHYNGKTKEWDNWCTDLMLWYCYNVVVFNKGIPAMLMK